MLKFCIQTCTAGLSPDISIWAFSCTCQPQGDTSPKSEGGGRLLNKRHTMPMLPIPRDARAHVPDTSRTTGAIRLIACDIPQNDMFQSCKDMARMKKLAYFCGRACRLHLFLPMSCHVPAKGSTMDCVPTGLLPTACHLRQAGAGYPLLSHPPTQCCAEPLYRHTLSSLILTHTLFCALRLLLKWRTGWPCAPCPSLGSWAPPAWQLPVRPPWPSWQQQCPLPGSPRSSCCHPTGG
mmetsp:Transcript_20991/g.45983  ORF Transcript_20991/g.45983 Transcript_20991/m.45983 type:complete len:236 (-) Transcript_20991:675-1382(-)